jgi:enoyl-CoA hydratase
MEYKNLLIENRSGVLVLSIHRPEALNALNTEVMQELKDFFESPENKAVSIKGIVVTGSGQKAFVAGADIKGFQGLGEDKGRSLAIFGQEVFNLIERFPRPVIAAVNGFALGGGCELAMACHFRLASDKAKFGQPEVNLGLIPGYGGTQRLPLLIGKGKAMELLMTGDMISAEEAHRLGLVNYLVPSEELLDKCIDLIEKISTKAPLAIQKIISTVNSTFSENVNHGLAGEANAFGACMNTEDFEEGVSAFLEKRKPDFSGR